MSIDVILGLQNLCLGDLVGCNEEDASHLSSPNCLVSAISERVVPTDKIDRQCPSDTDAQQKSTARKYDRHPRGD